MALSRPMRQAGLVSRGQMLRAAYGQLIFQLFGADERRMEKAKRAILEISRGWDRAQVEELVREAVVEVIDPFVYQEALDLMDVHRAEGRKRPMIGIERFDFYDRARESYAVIQTGERRFYGCFLLRKGVIGPGSGH